MAIAFANIFKNMLGGQLLMRVCSFSFNFVLLRIVDPSILGFFNVRMNLLYNTIGFISREPTRKLCLGSDVPENEISRYAIISPVISLLAAICCCSIWFFTWQNSAELAIGTLAYLLVLGAFSFSIFLEISIEPIIVQQLKTGSTDRYVRNNAILMFTQRMVATLALLLGINPLFSFTISQVVASLLYALLFILPNPMVLVQLYKDAVQEVAQGGFDPNHVRLLKMFIFHSFFKQFLTDGTNFLMTFGNVLPLKVQAVYDAIERLASLAVRLVLQPFEESAAIYFGINMKRGEGHEVAPDVVATFLLLTRLITSFGLFLLVYGSSYATLAAQLYGGSFFIENQADHLLFWYSLYLPVIALNGLSECFTMAMLDAKQLLSHTQFLVCSVAAHLTLSYFCCHYFGAKGFIIANIVNCLARIGFNWRFIRARASSMNSGDAFLECMPRPNIASILFLSWIILFTSSKFLSETKGQAMIHVSIGSVLLIFIACTFYKTESAAYREFKLKNA